MDNKQLYRQLDKPRRHRVEFYFEQADAIDLKAKKESATPQSTAKRIPVDISPELVDLGDPPGAKYVDAPKKPKGVGLPPLAAPCKP